MLHETPFVNVADGIDGIDGDGWHSTGAYCTAKLTFSHGSLVKVWGAYCTSVRIVFEILRYIKYPIFSNENIRCMSMIYIGDIYQANPGY